MNVIQQLKLGFRSLMLHKLRLALAVLGILIGDVFDKPQTS